MMVMISGPAKPVRGDWLDGVAVCASAACLVHCLVLPLVLAALPMLSEWLDVGEGFHVAMLALAVPISALALVGGWRRHRAVVPLALGTAGLALMIAGVVLAQRETTETALTVAGSLLLAGAHVANWRRRRMKCSGA